jgi:hypothetical protein
MGGVKGEGSQTVVALACPSAGAVQQLASMPHPIRAVRLLTTRARHKPHAPLLVPHPRGQQEPGIRLRTTTYLTDTGKLTSSERWTCTASYRCSAAQHELLDANQ